MNNNNVEKHVVPVTVSLGQTIWIYAGILIIVFIFTYLPTLSLLVHTWFYSPDAYHGVLVPFISLYFVWISRDRLKKIRIKQNIIGGLVLLIVGNLLLLFGKFGAVLVIELFSLIIIISAIVLLLLGIRFLGALALPLSYLVLMVPFTDAVDEIHMPFRQISATMSAYLLNVLNIPVVHNGLYLELPGTTLEVAVACSGLNFLISITAIAVPLAMFTFSKLWPRFVLIVSGLIIGVVTNWFRITLIGIWTYLGGKGVHGPLHIFQGFFVSVLGFIFLFIVAWAIDKFNGSEEFQDTKVVDNHVCIPPNANKLKNALIMLILFLFSVNAYQHFAKIVPVPTKMRLSDIPAVVGNWHFEHGGEKAPFEIGDADFSISRIYRNTFGREIILYVGYFEQQYQGKELIDYKLRDLFKDVNHALVGSVPANIAVFRNGNQYYETLFWYEVGGRSVSNRYKAKFFTALDGIFKHRTNGAIIMIFSKIEDSIGSNTAFKDEVDFVEHFLPELRRYL